MIKNIGTLIVATSLISLAACKKEDASSKIDPNAVEIPPATSEVVVTEVSTDNQTTTTVVETEQATGKYPVMNFSKVEHDFGKVKQGDKVEYDFKFKNTGESDLIITDAKGSCGCTVPEYPKEPVKPGQSGVIKVSYNSAGKSGQESKSVTITCNTQKGSEMLNIKATVEAPAVK